MARIFSRKKVQEIVDGSGLAGAVVLDVVKNRRNLLRGVRAWVEQNEGETEEAVLEGALGGDTVGNREVLAVAEALDWVVRIE